MTLELLFPHFDELVRTPEDVQRLNEAILQLAVQGKLVPQDPEDEPASGLLRQNRSQSEQLRIKDGARTGIGHDPIIKTAPFVIPAGWVWIRLGEIIESMTNGIYKPASFYDDRGIACLRMYNIQAGAISFHDLKRMELTADELHAYGLRAGDLIVNRVNSRELVGKAAVIPALVEPLVYESKNIRVRFRAGCVQPEFVSILFRTTVARSIFDEIAKQTTGQASINQTQLSDLQIPLPPLAEQHRIVAKVDELFAQTRALEAKLRQSQADIVTANRAALHRLHRAQDDGQFQAAWRTLRDHFDLLYDDPRNVAELRQAILDLAVRGKLVPQEAEDEPAGELLKTIEGEKQRLAAEGKYRGDTKAQRLGRGEMPFDLPWNWVWTRLGAITISRDGERIPVSKEERSQRAKIYDYYGASGVIDKIDGFLFDKPLLLIGEDGANLINRSTPIAFIARGRYWVNNHAHVLDAISEEFLRYLELHINAIDLKPYVTGTAQPKMNQAKMNSIPIALPPLAEQHRIVAKVDQLMRLCDALQAGLVQAEVQRRGLTAAVLFGVTADSGPKMIDARKSEAGERTTTH